ncbi:hypothetical protein KR044_011529, partial [Drosophila immigrans]
TKPVKHKTTLVNVSWVYYRRKDELVAMATEFGLEVEGNVSDLRSRLALHISRGDHSEETTRKMEELASQYANEHSDSEAKTSRTASPVAKVRRPSPVAVHTPLPRVVVTW